MGILFILWLDQQSSWNMGRTLEISSEWTFFFGAKCILKSSISKYKKFFQNGFFCFLGSVGNFSKRAKSCGSRSDNVPFQNIRNFRNVFVKYKKFFSNIFFKIRNCARAVHITLLTFNPELRGNTFLLSTQEDTAQTIILLCRKTFKWLNFKCFLKVLAKY